MADHSPIRPLIISPNVNFAFGQTFVHSLLGSNAPSESPPINLLISPLESVELPANFGPFLVQKPSRLNVFFGSAGNKALVRKIVDEQQINAIFLFLDGNDEPNDETSSSEIVARTRQFLIGQLCPLLEAIRQCPSTPKRPTLVPIFFEPPNANFLQSPPNAEQIPTVLCHSEASARFSSAHALLHSFAVSYRLNIQIAVLPARPSGNAVKFVLELAHKEGGKAQIHRFSLEKEIDGKEATEIKPNTRIRLVRALIFGHQTSVDKAKLSEIIGGDIGQVMEAETKPGLDGDEAVDAELLAKGPTHVGFVAGAADEKTLADWEAGGPAHLRNNVRQNLFTPWLLRQICTKFGINFFMLNESNNKNAQEPIEANSRCAVVSHFAEKLAKLEAEVGQK